MSFFVIYTAHVKENLSTSQTISPELLCGQENCSFYKSLLRVRYLNEALKMDASLRLFCYHKLQNTLKKQDPFISVQLEYTLHLQIQNNRVFFFISLLNILIHINRLGAELPINTTNVKKYMSLLYEIFHHFPI